MRFKLYLQTGTLLFVKGRASARTWGRDEGQMEFKIGSMDLLSDAREKYITSLQITFEAERMDEAVVDLLTSTLKASPGKCKLKFAMVSNEEHISVELPSKGVSISVNEQLIQALDQIPTCATH